LTRKNLCLLCALNIQQSSTTYRVYSKQINLFVRLYEKLLVILDNLKPTTRLDMSAGTQQTTANSHNFTTQQVVLSTSKWCSQ